MSCVACAVGPSGGQALRACFSAGWTRSSCPYAPTPTPHAHPQRRAATTSSARWARPSSRCLVVEEVFGSCEKLRDGMRARVGRAGGSPSFYTSAAPPHLSSCPHLSSPTPRPSRLTRASPTGLLPRRARAPPRACAITGLAAGGPAARAAGLPGTERSRTGTCALRGLSLRASRRVRSSMSQRACICV